LDLLERYFAQAPSEKAADVRPDVHYQVREERERRERDRGESRREKEGDAWKTARVFPS